jgi:hypothetical protein
MGEQTVLLWQLDAAKSLLDIATAGLTDGEALRAPSSEVWTVRRGSDQLWVADWADDHPDPPPPTTVAWLLWHIGWWWSDVTGRAFAYGPVKLEDATWPGLTPAGLRQLAGRTKREG